MVPYSIWSTNARPVRNGFVSEVSGNDNRIITYKVTGDSFDASSGLISTVILWSLFINHSTMGMEKSVSCRNYLPYILESNPHPNLIRTRI